MTDAPKHHDPVDDLLHRVDRDVVEAVRREIDTKAALKVVLARIAVEDPAGGAKRHEVAQVVSTSAASGAAAQRRTAMADRPSGKELSAHPGMEAIGSAVAIVEDAVLLGFANPVNPTPAELLAWGYEPRVSKHLPPDWDLLVASNDRLSSTLLDLALDPDCPARRFALHCLYILASDAVRTKFRAHPRHRLNRLVERADELGDDLLAMWAFNARLLVTAPELFEYGEWCEGGLVRNPRRLKPPAPKPLE
jgi:hypothetical protein